MLRKIRRVAQAQLPLFMAICYLLYLGWHLLFSGFIRETLGGLDPEEYLELNPAKFTVYGNVKWQGSPRPWFFRHGTIFPTPHPEVPNLWHNANIKGDRIVDQLMWTLGGSRKPPKRRSILGAPYPPKSTLKTILLYNGLSFGWGTKLPPGRSLFLQQRCPVNLCRLTGNRKKFNHVDLVLFPNSFGYTSPRPPGQLWIMYQQESPNYSRVLTAQENNLLNLTASYRHDSDIVVPYAKWVYYDPKVRNLPQVRNYAQGKMSKVAMFTSNCATANKRLEYARELGRFIQVDIYGACGDFSCPCDRNKECFEMLQKDYKFYLAFENSNCRDYITEKFFVNALGNDILPIVMGAHPQDYRRVAPEHSFIHVEEFKGPRELANYLTMLDEDDGKYNAYFRWKGTGQFINTFFFCRLCAMAHYAKEWNPGGEKGGRIVKDYNKWWRGPDVCTTKLWKNTTNIFPLA